VTQSGRSPFAGYALDILDETSANP